MLVELQGVTPPPIDLTKDATKLREQGCVIDFGTTSQNPQIKKPEKKEKQNREDWTYQAMY